MQEEEDLGTLNPQVVVEQIEGLDRTLIDALGSQNHLSCRLWASQSDVMEVEHQPEGTQVVRGMVEVGQGGLCEKREGRGR